MSDHREQWHVPERDLPPDVQRDVNQRGARTVWRELERHGVQHPTHKPDCACHRCAATAATDREDDQ